jgi:hypothetical protein
VPASVLLWFLLACILVLPVLLAFVGDEPPDNAIVHEQEDEPRQDPDDLLAVAA